MREAVLLGLGVLAAGGVLVFVGTLAVDLVVPRLPPSLEVRLFGSVGDALFEASASDDPRLSGLVERLAAHWPDCPYAFRVFVLEAEAPNAFALPGGAIGVTSALLNDVESENELAFVVAHELGHFHERHHLRSLGRGLLLGLIVGRAGPGTLMQLGPSLASRSFDRDQEREADAYGLELVFQEYGHVGSASGFFRSLEVAGGERLAAWAAYLSSHPVSRQRIEDLEALARARDWPVQGPVRSFPPPPTPLN